MIMTMKNKPTTPKSAITGNELMDAPLPDICLPLTNDYTCIYVFIKRNENGGRGSFILKLITRIRKTDYAD